MPHALRRFWFEFSKDGDIPGGFRLGCGVTAWSIEDAIALIRANAFGNRDLHSYTVKADIDVSTLDAGHVLPNMLPPNIRGIWFPVGYTHSIELDIKHYRDQAGHHYGAAQECLDYASEAKHPRLREAWTRVADCNQDLAIAFENLADVTNEIGRH